MSKLAGYIGAATVELAWVESKVEKPILMRLERFDSKSFSDLQSVLRLYFKKHPSGSSEQHEVCLGIAGPVLDNNVSTTNLPWRIEGESLQNEFSFSRVRLVNDIVATAYGLSRLDEDKFFTIHDAKPVDSGHVGLIAAGGGLGQALIFRDGKRSYPYASEGGHTDFAPANQTEMELWEYLYSERGQVEVEDVVSHLGLERIYAFVVDSLDMQPAEWFVHAEQKYLAIIEKALAGQDEQAVRALDIFIGCYASEAANLALKGMTLGGIYVGGSIAPRILTALENGRFMERFVKRGKMESLLSQIPVGVIIEEKAALIGAAEMVLSL